MIILAAVALSVTIDIGPKPKPPQVTCHHGAVSYLFVGQPGVKFVYDGKTYSIPPAGSVELVADQGKGEKYVLAGLTHTIEAGQLDAFGTQKIEIK
jgi:hypothetical protein